MTVKTTVAGAVVGAVGLVGAIVGVDYTNDIQVDGVQRFDNVVEYNVKRDKVYQSIEAHLDYKKDGTAFLNFGEATVDYKEFSDMINILNFEKERCGMVFHTPDFAQAFRQLKDNCIK